MSYSFKNDNYEISKDIPNLIGEVIYCPKCGVVNLFDQISTNQICFCERCETKLNDIWDKFQEGKIDAKICDSCKKTTFSLQKYCIVCGEKQKHYTISVEKKEKIVTDLKPVVTSNIDITPLFRIKRTVSPIFIIFFVILLAIPFILMVISLIFITAQNLEPLEGFWWDFFFIDVIIVMPISLCLISILFIIEKYTKKKKK